MTLEELERLRLPLQTSEVKAAKADEEKKLNLQATELEQRQKLWRWLLVAALVVLVMETWLAGWLTRRHQQAPA
jgi:anti-sigma-K factor RskA